MKVIVGNSRRTVMWVIAIINISTVAAMAVTWRAPALNLAARDALVRAQGRVKPPDEVVIVAIDEPSIKRFGRFPWPRGLMAQALRRLSDAHPKVIALNVLYSEPTNETDDAALTEAIKSAGNVVVAAQLVETPLGAEWLRPLPAIERAAAATSHGNVLMDFDGVARALTLREADDEGNALWAMAVEVMRVGDGLRSDDARDTPEGVKIGSRVIPIEADAEPITFLAREPQYSPQTFRASRMTIDYIGPAGSFADKTLSIADLIDGQASPEKLNACRGRYVLIGATAAAMSDRVASPFASFASDRGARNAALIAAAVVSALILAQGGRELIKQIAALLGITGLILGLSYFAFVRLMISPPLTCAIVSLIVAAPLALLLRSLTASASLDDRIAEMTLESARLSPFAIESELVDARPSRWPRGIGRKARSLAALQNRLLARTQFLDRSIQSVEDGLMIADGKGRIAFANRCAARILGLT